MSQEIQPVKKTRGRPRKNPLPIETSESVAVIEDVETVVDTEEDEKDFIFISTGNSVKDRALKGVITDSPILFQTANSQKMWESICASANPAGECEKFAISQFVKDPNKVLSTLLEVKRLLVRNRDGLTVIKAFQLSKLQDFIDRVTSEGVAISPVVVKEKKVEKQVVVPVETKPEFVKGQIVKNPDDPSQTWTVGSRGRRAKWFDKLIELNAINIKKEEHVVETVKPESTVIVNPDDPNDTFDLSKRGRRKLWVVEYLKTHKV